MNRKLYIGSLVLAALASFVAGKAQRKIVSREITAQRFVLMDQDGHKRAEMGMSPADKPYLRFFDEKGKVVWSANEGGAYLVHH